MNQFKRAQVVMLSTEKATELSIQTMNYCGNYIDRVLSYTTNKTLIRNHHLISNRKAATNILDKYEFYNLYIISDDEIKEGDYYILFTDNVLTVLKCTGDGDYFDCKKIIATTDVSLKIRVFNSLREWTIINLPQPSQQFIEKYIESYNKGEVITDVLVEYELIAKCIKDKTCNCNILYECNKFETKTFHLKVNPKDNTITIKKLKDCWNREEHIADIRRLIHTLYYSPNREVDFDTKKELDNWIDKNL